MAKFRYKWLFHLTPDELLFVTMPNALRKQGYNDIKYGNEYIYAKGEVPILLVAHVDTVFNYGERLILHDSRHNIIWSPDGLGADDRAGIAAIIEILNRGLKPHVVITNGEENGATGAREAANEIDFPKLKFAISLDRKGSKDAVYYGCANKEFKEYIESFGFKTGIGTFSDISIICPTIGIAGVNLSIGYYLEHTYSEFLMVEVWHNTINRVCSILQDENSKYYEYISDFGKTRLPHIDWFSHSNSDYAEYGSCRTKTRSQSGENGIYIDPVDLAILFDGTCDQWASWLYEKEHKIMEYVYGLAELDQWGLAQYTDDNTTDIK